MVRWLRSCSCYSNYRSRSIIRYFRTSRLDSWDWYCCGLLFGVTCMSKLKKILKTYQLSVNFSTIFIFTCLTMYHITRAIYPTVILFILMVLNIFTFEYFLSRKYNTPQKRAIPATLYFILTGILSYLGFLQILDK